MRLEILYVPTTDLEATLGVYRDGLGYTELWREGASTVALTKDGSELQIMIDEDPDAETGPMFVVDSVVAFHEALPAGLTVVDEPAQIPGGWLASYREPGGSVLYAIDQATAAAS
ncbi:hypothetical protein SAMN04487783_0590 [Agrococcus baldri]|uniref:VOC domain-containing protein n=1 Tax=Agrococcus baldri TaxID=153730 RepID=A0AA94HKV0_9MICO|nr:hypothetical protein [Agrococcus baldri]SFS01794.1 hypothetical protein SAMN04487783_0590 [Agrococcus baldri]